MNDTFNQEPDLLASKQSKGGVRQSNITNQRVSTENERITKMTRKESEGVGGSVVIQESTKRMKKNDGSDGTPNIDSMVALEKMQSSSGGVKGSLYVTKDNTVKKHLSSSNTSERRHQMP